MKNIYSPFSPVDAAVRTVSCKDLMLLGFIISIQPSILITRARRGVQMERPRAAPASIGRPSKVRELRADPNLIHPAGGNEGRE